jgi:TonB family protein
MWIAELVLRPSIVVLLALASSAALRRRSAAVRHMVLATGILGAATVTPFSWVLPVWQVALPPAVATWSEAPVDVEEPAALSVASRSASGADRSPMRERVAAALMLGVLIALSLLVIRVIRLGTMTAGARHVLDERWLQCRDRLSAVYGLRTPVVLLETRTSDVIATWGLFRACVLLPSDAARWDEPRIHIVLAHELAHVRRRDWLTQVASDIVRAVFWFNPLFWLACRRLRCESEQACDDAVLRIGVAPQQYAAQLMEIARTRRQSPPAWISALPIARPSSLEGRITAMLHTTRDRETPTRRALVTTIAGVFAAVIAISAAGTASQTGPRPFAGHVYDATGAVLPQVTVTLEAGDAANWNVITNSAGRFDFPSVRPGRYVLSASLTRFRPFRHEVVLENARDWDRAITLQVAALREEINVTERRRPAAGRPAAVPDGAPLRVGGNISPPLKTVDVKPVYPAAMREAGLEGIVPIEATIGPNGSVTSVRVVSAQVHPDFAIAAVDAVRRWQFTPTLLNGAPVEVVMTVTVQFSLSE